MGKYSKVAGMKGSKRIGVTWKCKKCGKYQPFGWKGKYCYHCSQEKIYKKAGLKRVM